MAILLLETLHPEAERALQNAADLIRAETPSDPGPHVPWDRITAIVTRGRGRVTNEVMQKCPALRVVARAGVGLDNVDLLAAERRGIPVVYTPGANTHTVAEHTMALMLCLVRGIVPMAAAVASGQWQRRDGYNGDELPGKMLGLVGFGAIGQRVAALAAAFDMKVVVARHPSVTTNLATLPFDDLLGQADVLSLHLPLTATTRGLVNREALARMKPRAFLINTARGALVDEAAVAEAVTAGALAGFAADVLAEEPPPAGHPLLTTALLTPHVASLTAATYHTMCVRAASAVAALLGGQDPDPRCVYRPAPTIRR